MKWDNMTKAEQLGENIRLLRESFRESQETLGGFLDVTKQSVSEYEKGTKTPKKNKIAEIAARYMVTVDDLLYGDFSDFVKFRPLEFNLSAIDLARYFPKFKSTIALQNEHFKRAFDIHTQLFKETPNNISIVNRLNMCLDDYLTSFDDEDSIQRLVEANVLSLWHYFMMISKNYPRYFEGRTAVSMQLAKEDPILNRQMIFGPSPELVETMNSVLSLLNAPRALEIISDILVALKHDAKWWELADYYYAVRYLFNINGKDTSPEMNAAIGTEMLGILIEQENPFAEKLLSYFLEAIPSLNQLLVDDN